MQNAKQAITSLILNQHASIIVSVRLHRTETQLHAKIETHTSVVIHVHVNVSLNLHHKEVRHFSLKLLSRLPPVHYHPPIRHFLLSGAGTSLRRVVVLHAAGVCKDRTLK